MNENIMSYIGKLIFVLLCAKYRNDQNEYLALMKLDRMSKYYSGVTSFEYTDWIKTKEQEQGFLNNLEDGFLPSQYLNELTQHPHENVEVKHD